MKIKRYTAASMRAALALVRAEQGPDAVILSSRRSDEGIEVIAAVDYDEALFAEANRQRTRRRPRRRRRRGDAPSAGRDTSARRNAERRVATADRAGAHCR